MKNKDLDIMRLNLAENGDYRREEGMISQYTVDNNAKRNVSFVSKVTSLGARTTTIKRLVLHGKLWDSSQATGRAR